MTPIFDSLDAAWRHYVTQLLTQLSSSSRDGDARELIGASFTLSDPSKCWLINDRRNLSPYYAAAEILWYASGSADVGMISRYAPQYKRFAEADGEAYGAYGRRLKGVIEEAIRSLIVAPDSRRVVVGLWDVNDLSMGHTQYVYDDEVQPVKDVPCTLTWQFLARDGKLHMVVGMRSNDMWLGTPYDVFWNCTAMRLVANELGLGLGTYTHHVGSLHLYEKHRDAAQEAVTEKPREQPRVWAYSGPGDTWGSLSSAVAGERAARVDGEFSLVSEIPAVIGPTLLGLCKNYLCAARYVAQRDAAMQSVERRYLDLRLKKGGEEK